MGNQKSIGLYSESDRQVYREAKTAVHQMEDAEYDPDGPSELTEAEVVVELSEFYLQWAGRVESLSDVQHSEDDDVLTIDGDVEKALNNAVRAMPAVEGPDDVTPRQAVLRLCEAYTGWSP